MGQQEILDYLKEHSDACNRKSSRDIAEALNLSQGSVQVSLKSLRRQRAVLFNLSMGGPAYEYWHLNRPFF